MRKELFSGKRFRGKILILYALSLFLIFAYLVPFSEAHILIVADADNTTPQAYDVLHATADALKSQGYNVLELYGENATTENIIKGMYNADAVIYGGHGGYEYGHYDGNGGPATAPFALVGSDGFLWGVGDKMRAGWFGNSFPAPFKRNIPVILYGACFSTGWVEDKEVSNPTETIYNFSEMFTGAGANYYATAFTENYKGHQIVGVVAQFLNGASNFGDANQKTMVGKITKSTDYDGQTIWRNDHGYSAFVGNWSGTFPNASQTSPYNDSAAEKWYNDAVGSSISFNGESGNITADLKNLYGDLVNALTDLLNNAYNTLNGL